MENQVPWQEPQREPLPAFETGKKELLFGLLLLISALGLCNFTLFGGFNLGFAMGQVACIACAFFYLLASGCAPDWYSGSLLALSVIIAAGFARSDDGFVKFVMFCFLTVSTNLGLCLMAKKNRYRPGSLRTVLDAPGTFFRLGFGKLPEAFHGLGAAFRKSGSAGQKGGAFLLGVFLCIPLLAIMIPLLMSADAAFDGLMGLLPEFDLEELLATVIFGLLLWAVLYTRAVALRKAPAGEAAPRQRKGIHAITVNTVLGAAGLVYLVYLLSQLAYFSGGFAGILPEGYSVAEYARRGFFEMALLSGIDLTVMVFSLGLVRREGSAPLATKLLCLFLGVVTLFLVSTASAKMFLYIGSFGLTSLRVLTQIVMLFMAITTVIICVWLFLPKLPYMKVLLLVALTMGAVTLWVDVDTQVARYNVDAYLSGRLETVDVLYLYQLGDEGIPQLARLMQEATDIGVQSNAKRYLSRAEGNAPEDFREWNYVNQKALEYMISEN